MSRWYGDFAAGATVRIPFNTNDSTGAPITLAGTPTAAVYKDASTTESTTGVTLSVDFDSRTGSHVVVVDTSADGTFYSAGSEFRVVLTAGTVSGVSVVGAVAGAFSIANRSTVASLAAIKARTDLIPDIIVSGTVSGTPTTTSIVGAAGVLSATNDLYNGMFLVFTSGTLKGIGMEITDYVGSSRTFTTDPFPVAAAGGDTFILVGRKDT